MKTTIEISDALLSEAKAIAKRDGTTIRSLVEAGLRAVVRDKANGRKPFRLRDVSYGGDGLQPGVREGDWTAIRDSIYEGRGG